MRAIDADRLLTDRMKSKYYHLPNGDTAIPIIDIEHAPTVQPDHNTVSRQAVIDTVHKIILGFFSDEDGAMTDTEKTLLSVSKAVCNGVRELPSADLSGYSDRLWHNAYERGKAEAQQRWIPCSEKLPEANGRYLVTRGLVAAGALWNRVYIANYSNLMGIKSVKIWWQGNVGKSDFERLDDVLAWMPLPETYREEGE